MSFSVVPKLGAPRQIDSRKEPEESVTPEDAADAPKLARLLTRMLVQIAELRRRFWPRVAYFKDIDTNTVSKIRICHGFGRPVEWWVTRVDAAADENLGEDPSTDDNTLVLTSNGTSVVNIRVEESG